MKGLSKAWYYALWLNGNVYRRTVDGYVRYYDLNHSLLAVFENKV